MSKWRNTMRKISFYKKYILSMTFIDWFSIFVDLTNLACLIIFTFYFGVEVGKAIGA